MSELLFRIIRALALTAVMFLLVKAGREHKAMNNPGWRAIIGGFLLLIFGTMIDITGQSTGVADYSEMNEVAIYSFLELFVGYICGLLSIGWGFSLWLPLVASSKENEQALFNLKERYRHVSELTTDMIAVCKQTEDGPFFIEWAVGSLPSKVGYSLNEFRKQHDWFKLIHPDDHLKVHEHINDGIHGEHSEIQLRLLSKDRTKIFWVSAHTTTLGTDKEGLSTSLLLALRDITDRVKAEQATKQSLEENKILLQELHHRVKNNLQIIIGLMEMAKSRITDPEVGRICQDIHGKIGSMSLVHTLLYKSEQMGHIDFGQYARTLSSQLAEMYDCKDLEVRMDTDRVYLPIDKAVPCGLALNELLTNAFKHSDSCGSDTVDVTIQKTEETVMVIKVRDNGPGIRRDAKESGDGIGLKLLDNLVTLQLGGSLEFIEAEGTEAIIRLPLAR